MTQKKKKKKGSDVLLSYWIAFIYDIKGLINDINRWSMIYILNQLVKAFIIYRDRINILLNDNDLDKVLESTINIWRKTFKKIKQKKYIWRNTITRVAQLWGH